MLIVVVNIWVRSKGVIGVLHQQLLLIGVKVDVMYQLVQSDLEMLMTLIKWAEVSK
jgi:hypothetical protein